MPADSPASTSPSEAIDLIREIRERGYAFDDNHKLATEVLVLAERATPGPWIVSFALDPYPSGIEAPNDRGRGAVGTVVRRHGIGLPSSARGQANAAFIAHARTSLPLLAAAFLSSQERAAEAPKLTTCDDCAFLCPVCSEATLTRELAEAQAEVERLKAVVKDMALEECWDWDGCQIDIGEPRPCIPCAARRALESRP